MVLLITGQYRVEYEDVLRALGNYLDANRFRHITLIETPDGFLTKGVRLQLTGVTSRLEPTTYLFTNDDIEIVLEQAHARRGVASPSAPLPGSVTRYEDLLRAIGKQIDEEKFYDVAIVQLASGTHVKALVRPDASSRHDDRVIDFHLDDDALKLMVDDMISGRRSKPAARTRGRWPF